MTASQATDPSNVSRSLSTVCGDVRRRIIRGAYPAGRRLTEEELAAEFKVSRMSVREALRLLEAEGFVRVQPYFGTFVEEMTSKQASDLLEVQGALEPLAAGLAAGRRTAEHLAELHALVAEGRAAAGEGRGDDAAALHGRFHAVLADASGNDSLSVLVTQLRHKIDWVYSSQVPRPPGDSWDEHAEIVLAIENADQEHAVGAAKRHIQRGSAAREQCRDPPAGRAD
jgi:DNA-binding GntR family transcriptional regulator